MRTRGALLALLLAGVGCAPRAPSGITASSGWVLIVPPWSGTEHAITIETAAPTARWGALKAFDKAQECEREVDNLPREGTSPGPFATRAAATAAWGGWARCVPAAYVYPPAGR